MSWFDATGFASLAKSALKEAQKTIDKALDIKDEDQKLDARTDDTSDFFASWGLKSEEQTGRRHDTNKDSKQEAANSIWGSFTGSFFESPKLNIQGNRSKRISHSKSLQSTSSEKLEKPLLTSSLSFSDDYRDKHANRGKNSEFADDCEEKKPVENLLCESIDSSASDVSKAAISTDGNTVQSSSSIEVDETKDRSNSDSEKGDSSERCSMNEGKNEAAETGESECERKEMCEGDSSVNSRASNSRVSLISLENDKRSVESVEILGSQSNTDCTTTPESDGNSLSNSASPTAMGVRVNSESVEILPDSLVTSPSSVEILGDWKSDGSPYLSPVDPRRSESSSVIDREDSITPCWEDINVAQVSSKPTSSSSDISPYESPLEEAETPHGLSCTSSLDSTPSTGTYPGMGSHSMIKPLSTAVSSRTSKPSAESVEPIPDADEPDEASLAEDSYTSASETTVMTILETFQQIEQAKSKIEVPVAGSSGGKMHDSCPDGKQTLLKGGTSDSRLNLSLDSLKEKHQLRLPIEAITRQPIRNSEYFEGTNTGKMPETDRKSFDRLLNATIEPAEPERYPACEQHGHSFKSDIGATDSAADQQFILTDSSCEGTLIESGSEDASSMIRKSDGKVSETPLTASSYVKTMLADAMIEKSGELVEAEGQRQATEVPRENSPISSESRSDLVKIGSDQTSGHTSGDELETTTSSDIEIISSPNGDSSSTQSRQSLAKLQSTKGGDLLTKTLKSRGHSRELSEISVGSDDASLEMEKLLKRIQEMTEILEARESKLIDVSRMNMELHEQNNNLKRQLDSFEKHAEQSQSLNQITDEYTQRLSALERKFQQAIRERDSLRKNLEQLKVEAATRLSSQEMFTLSAEKDEIIKELREEGDKLSKQQLQHSNIIKRLRAKEKENDALMKSQKEQIEEQTLELERLKKSLHAKEEVERTQIEAVHTLTAKTKKQEKEILLLQEKLDNALHKMDAYKKSLDAAKMDLTETKKVLTATEADLKDATNNAGESCQLLAQVEELKMKLRESEEMHVKKEDYLKHENSELLKRLEAAEARSEELSESVSMATKPLLRQLEQLQVNLLHKTNSFMKQEKALSEKNIELQTKVESLIEMDRYLKEENVNLKTKLSQLESKLTAKETEKTQLRESYEESMVQNEKLVEENVRHQQTIQALQQSHSLQLTDLNREIVALENKLAVEKAATDAERRKNHAMSEQQIAVGGDGEGEDGDEDDDDERRQRKFSSAVNVEQHSVNAIVDSVWPLYNSPGENVSDRYTMLYGSIRAGSSSTSIFENLQAQLKQKDGEIQQLQWELSRRNTERDALNTELSTLTLKIEELNNKVTDVTALNESLRDIQTRYDALLQMYGEKMEENQELRLDLEDIKEMYKTQIDQLLKRDT